MRADMLTDGSDIKHACKHRWDPCLFLYASKLIHVYVIRGIISTDKLPSHGCSVLTKQVHSTI